MKIEQKRRELFESWYSKREGGFMPSFFGGEYDWADAQPCWLAFNAALDAVVIELPTLNNSHVGGPDSVYGPSIEQVEDAGFDYGVNACRAAIESTGLGLKVLP